MFTVKILKKTIFCNFPDLTLQKPYTAYCHISHAAVYMATWFGTVAKRSTTCSPPRGTRYTIKQR